MQISGRLLHHELGALYGMQVRVDEAGRSCRVALAIDPRNTAARKGIGRLRHGPGR